MTTEIMAVRDEPAILERVIALGDLSKLTPDERIAYYRAVCESVGLNPLTKPLDYITLNGKLTLYANKGATDQIRRNRGVSIDRVEREIIEGIYVVTVYGHDATGRTDSDMGTVPVRGLTGDNLANAMLKSLTKAKRRLTLSLCGLGMLDELEVATIPSALRVDVDQETGEILRTPPVRIAERVTEPPVIAEAELEAFNDPVSEPLGLDDPALFAPVSEPPPHPSRWDAPPLTKEQIRELLAGAGITPAEAATRAATLFPEWSPRKEMSDAMRGCLWDSFA
jgi:hypothetical protein